MIKIYIDFNARETAASEYICIPVFEHNNTLLKLTEVREGAEVIGFDDELEFIGQFYHGGDYGFGIRFGKPNEKWKKP